MPTPDAWLVPLHLTPGRPSVLTIEERRPVRRTIAIGEIAGAPQLSLYIENADLDPDIEQRLRAIIELRTTLGRTQDAESELRQRLTDLATRSAELRENLRATDRAATAAAPFRRQLLAQLGRTDAEMTQLTTQLSTVRATALDLRSRLSDALRDLRVDPAPI
jgi:chromosome segregation ATPase